MNEKHTRLSLHHAWREERSSSDLDQGYNVARDVPDHDRPRKQWSALNRIQTGRGRCDNLMRKWNILPSPNCDCGHPNHQTISHVVNEYPNRKYNESLEDFSSALLSIV